jgi:hypothetical protein
MTVAVGSVEWFRHRRRALIEHLKAIDDFGSAARSFRKLIEVGQSGDADVHAALHAAGVISYTRPFSGPVSFSKRLISKEPGFRNNIHDQLIVLRNKLIAHSDAEFADARLFLKTLRVNNASGSARSSPIGAVVMARNLHTVHDVQLATACLTHTEAALRAASDSMSGELQVYAAAVSEYPESYAAHRAEKPDAMKINAGNFSLNQDQPAVAIPRALPDPNKLLSLPPLKLGSDGYVYRVLLYAIEITGSLSFKMPDGTDLEVSISQTPADAPHAE